MFFFCVFFCFMFIKTKRKSFNYLFHTLNKNAFQLEVLWPGSGGGEVLWPVAGGGGGGRCCPQTFGVSLLPSCWTEWVTHACKNITFDRFATRAVNICHGTAVCDLSTPVRLLRHRALVTVAPPFLFFSRSRLRFTRLPTSPGMVNDVIGTSPVTSHSCHSDVTIPSWTL